MPKRVIDGEALWRSRKLKAVASEFRAEYANLIPLAEANGSFDADPERIWTDVYAFNRPDVKVPDVVRILDEFEQHGLLQRWEQDGRVWGYWIGIEKTGRLPSDAHLGRYKNLPPNPPKDGSRSVPDNPGTCPEGFGFGFGVGIGSGLESDMRAQKQIPILSLRILGVQAERWESLWDDVKQLADAFGHTEVCRAFEEWAEQNKGEVTSRPVSEFLKVASGLLTGTISARPNPEAEELLADLYAAGDQVFSGKQREAVLRLLREYPAAEIKAAYDEFLDKRSDRTPFTVKEFADGGASAILLARKKRKAQEAETTKQLDGARHKFESGYQEVLAEIESREQQEQEALESELPE